LYFNNNYTNGKISGEFLQVNILYDFFKFGTLHAITMAVNLSLWRRPFSWIYWCRWWFMHWFTWSHNTVSV